MKKNHENEKITQKITRKQTKLRKKMKRLILQRSHFFYFFSKIYLWHKNYYIFAATLTNLKYRRNVID